MAAISESLKKNLDVILEEKIRGRNLDWVHVNVGGEGKGKSSFSLQVADYIDPEFSTDQIVFSGEEFRNVARDLDKGQVIVFDEGIEGLFAQDHAKKENKKTVRFLRQCRELNLYIIINLPVFRELDKKIRLNRVKSISRCVKQGWAHVYGKSQVQDILQDMDSSGVDWPEPYLKAGWKDPASSMPELWNSYQEKKLDNVRNLGEEKEEEKDDEDVNWLSTGTVAERLDVSSKTIRNWCDSGKLKVSRLPNGQRRIPETEVEELVS